MIRVAVCDDNAETTAYIQTYLQQKNAQLEAATLDISLYRSGEEFLKEIELGATFHIVLMDIQMDGINGVEVGRLLREKSGGDDAILVFISSYDDYFEELVQIGSFRFIRKPIDGQNLDLVFTRALNQAVKYKSVLNASGLFKYQFNKDLHFVRIDKIAYMKHSSRTTRLYVWEDGACSCINEFYEKLSQVITRLPPEQFVRCGQSYIVNLDYVKHQEKNSFVLRDKKATAIPIGRTFKAEANRAYFKHLESMT